MAAEATQIKSTSLTVSELFLKPFTYKIPDYQRDYSWEDEQVDALWEDITLQYITQRDPNEYFIGTIVVSKDNKNGEKIVVDGQQRLTTISIIMAVIRNIWKKRGDLERAQGVSSDYLGKKDRRTGDIKPRLILNENNNPVFQKCILEDEKDTSEKMLSPSNKLLLRSFERLQNAVESWLSNSSKPMEDLLSIEEFIGSNLTMILIEAASDADAFVIFETLNDRGLELAVSDLVKNHLFSKGGTYLSQFKKQWNDISNSVGQDEISKFLRYYMMSQGEFYRERDLYKAIRKSYSSTGTVRKFMDRLVEYSKIYSALSNSDSMYWKDFDSKVKDTLESIAIYRVSTYKIVALSALYHLEKDIALSILRVLEIISFRIAIVGASSTGQIEKVYSSLAGEIAKGKIKNAREAFIMMKDLYISDNEFEEAFRFIKTGKTQFVRYILARINDRIENSTVRRTEFNSRTSIEHIYPKSPTEYWNDRFVTAEEQMLSSSIGNLTLLESNLNRQVGNESFPYKKEKAYCKSQLGLNEFICSMENWLPQDIEGRARYLAKQAAQIWRLDF